MPRTLLVATALLAVGCGGDPINVTPPPPSPTSTSTPATPLPRPQEIVETRSVGVPRVVTSGPEIAADPRFELATHSQTHRAFRGDCYGLAVVPLAEMADEVRRPVEALVRISPRATRYFRSPGLCHDPGALAAVASVGLTAVVDGDSSGDAGGTSVDAIVHQTVDRAHPGSIVVMHLNGGDRAGLTDDALLRIIAGLRAKGLQPVTLGDLLNG